jgi:hypothetical protein
VPARTPPRCLRRATAPPYRRTAQDTDAYCRDTLCDPALVAFLNERFVCWAGDLRHSDAFRCAALHVRHAAATRRGHTLALLHVLSAARFRQRMPPRQRAPPPPPPPPPRPPTRLAASLRAARYPYAALLAFSGAR